MRGSVPGFPRPRHARRIAATELRCGWRSLRGWQPLQLGVVGLGVLMGLGITTAVAFGGYVAGEAIASGDLELAASEAAMAPAALWPLVAVLTAYVTAIQLSEVEDRDALLTTVPHRDVVGGLLLAGSVRTLGIVVPPALVGVIGVSIGAGSPATGLLGAVAVAAVATSAYAAGFALGLGAKHLLGRSAFVVRHRAALGAVGFVAYVALVLTDTVGRLLAPAVMAARESPVGWFADLALLALVDGASPPRAAAALGIAGVVTAGGVLAAVAVAGRLWYADPVVTDERQRGSSAPGETAGTGEMAPVAAGGQGAETGASREVPEVETPTPATSPASLASPAINWLERLFDQPTAWVVRKSWLRTRRAPIRLVYVAYPLFALVAPVRASVTAGHVVASLPPAVAIYGAWATGAAFALNPLGDEGAVTPVTLTTPVRGRQFVGGLVVAGAAIGLPATVVATLVLGIASPLAVPTAVVTAVVGAVLCPGAAGIAAGAGTLFPRFETAAITRSRKVVVPSSWAFLVYSVAFGVLAAPAAVAAFPGGAAMVADAAGVPTVAVRGGGVAASALLASAAGYAAWRYATRGFETYTFP